jgi:tryptophan synthase alpha chain
MQDKLAASIGPMTARIRQHTSLPVAVGFGISNAEQARQAALHADAIVVGSAVVNQMARLRGAADLVPQVVSFVASLANAVKRA